MKRKLTLPSQILLILATSPAAATLTCEAQEERSRLRVHGTAYGDIKVIIYIGLSPLVVRSILHV